jgi:hypothetical protein
MSQSRLRQLILVLVAFAVAAGGLLVPGSALAELALFRIENRWHNFPNPALTTPGNAGQGWGWVQPYVYLTKTMASPTQAKSPPGVAVVQPGNPIGSPFTLEQSFYVFDWTGTLVGKTAWPGYTTIYRYAGYNGPGKFEPNFGPTTTTRLFFPTTGGNAYPNLGQGNPVTPTTTYDGRYDVSRAGSIHVQPGPNRFGGTYRMFFDDVAGWYQWIYKWDPTFYKGYGYYMCWDDGTRCTPDTHVSEPGTTMFYSGYWWMLNKTGTGTGARTAVNTAKATKASTPYGLKPTVGGAGTPLYGNQASYLWRRQVYFNQIHPWTTGFAKVVYTPGSPDTGIITPQQTGYDTSLGGADLTVTYFDYDQNYNPGKGITTTTYTYKQYLQGVTRVVSMVRPRLVHTIGRPVDVVNNVIENIWNPVRLWNMRVFFLPEPAGMLLLGVGIAALLGLSRLRRR